MRKHHDKEREVYLRVYKKDAGIPSVTIQEALDVVLCWGWIDGVRKSYDADSYLQRYSPRRTQSPWSKINREHVARLIEAGRMTQRGQDEIDKAKADGRWDKAYAGAKTMVMPDDLLAAIKESPKAYALYRELDRTNLYSLAFRLGQLKTAAGRAKKIVDFVAMLEKGETIHPRKAQRAIRKNAPPRTK